MPRRPAMAWLQFLVVAVGALAFAYAALGFYAWQYSDGLIFLPPPPTYPNGRDILHIPATAGGTLAARYLPCPDARYTVVYFHGNAEDLGGVEPRLQLLRDHLQVSVLAWDYPGYGWSGGSAGEPATLRAAQAVLSCAAVNPDGVFNVNEMMAAVERRIIDVADEVILAADHTKFNKRSIARVCELDEIDALVTDWGADEQARGFLAAAGVNLVIAERQA